MPYLLTIPIVLGSSQTGLTLSAQVLDTSGANVGAATTSGFVEVGLGNYTWTGSIPDGHRGAVKFSAGATLKAIAGINPSEVEFPDVKTSSRADGAQYTTARAAKLDFLDASISGLPALVWSYSVRTLTAMAQAVDLTSNAISAIWNALVSTFSTPGSVGVLVKNFLDTTVSSRLAASSYMAPPTAQQNATATWSEPLPAAYAAGSAGYLLARAGSAGDPWATLLPGSYGAGTAGFLVGNRLDAAVSSRADGFYYNSTRALKLDFLDAAISSRADSQYYTPARAALIDNLTRLDVFVGTRSTLTALQVDTQLSGTHGPGSWEKGSLAGSGANTVGVILKDDGGSYVVGMAITIKSSDQSTTIAQQMTDSNGRAGFNLDAGTFAVLVASSPLYQTLPAQTLTVSGSMSVTYTLVRMALVNPGNGSGGDGGSTTQVYADIVRITGEPAVGVPVTFSLPWLHPGVELPRPGPLLEVKRSETVVTDNSGRFHINLVRSSALLAYLPPDAAKYRVECPLCAVDSLLTVPDVDSLDITSSWPPYPST